LTRVPTASAEQASSVARRRTRRVGVHGIRVGRRVSVRFRAGPEGPVSPVGRRTGGLWDEMVTDYRRAHQDAWRELRDDWRQLRGWRRSPDRWGHTRRWLLVLNGARRRQDRWRRRTARLAPGGVLGDSLVRSRLRHLSVHAAARDARRDFRWGMYAGILFLSVFVVLPLFLMAPLDVSWSWRLAALVGAFLAGALPAAVITAIRPRSGYRTSLVVIATPGLGLVVTAGAGFGPEPRATSLLVDASGRTADFLVVVARLSAVMYLALFVFFLLTLVYDVVVGYRRGMRRDPDRLAVECLGRLMDALTGPRRDLADPRLRRAMARELHTLADVVEYGFAAVLRLPSADGNAALRDRLRRVAAGIRSHQIAVAAPDVDTMVRLRHLVLACLGAVCTGRLGSLASVVDAEPRPVRRRALAVVSALRLLLVASAPLTVVLVLRDRSIMPKETLGGAIAAATIWALVVLMMALDPQFNTRIGAVRDLMSALRSGNTGK